MDIRVVDGVIMFATHFVEVGNMDMKNKYLAYEKDGTQFICYSEQELNNLVKSLTDDSVNYTVNVQINTPIDYPFKFQSRTEAIEFLTNGKTPIHKEEVDYKNKVDDHSDKITILSESQNIKIEDAKIEIEVKDKINKGEITKDNFNSLSLQDKEVVKLSLFKEYSPNQSDAARNLSAIEFSLVALMKILNKSIDRTKLTDSELFFFDSMVSTFNLNDMPINDTADWRYQYLHNQFSSTQTNRQEYFQKKIDVIGHI